MSQYNSYAVTTGMFIVSSFGVKKDLDSKLGVGAAKLFSKIMMLTLLCGLSLLTMGSEIIERESLLFSINCSSSCHSLSEYL
jgi:hypothetical protein